MRPDLADSTYQNQFNNANTNKTNAFNRQLKPVRELWDVWRN
jgi:hypothetical protein